MAQLQIGIKVSETKLLCFTKNRTRFNSSRPVYSCSFSTSADQHKTVAAADPSPRILEKKAKLGNDAGWHVRRMLETHQEMREVAYVQAEAFHQPLLLFNDLFFDYFKAEVLAGLIYRLKNSSHERYACLVAEQEKEIIGVVDVTVQNDSVLQHLPGAKEYLYVSGIAVLNRFRRRKVATSLLRACESLSAAWGFEYLVLRAYEDDYGARKLYSNAGYQVVSGDVPWMSSWIGGRRRLLMVKHTAARLQHL